MSKIIDLYEEMINLKNKVEFTKSELFKMIDLCRPIWEGQAEDICKDRDIDPWVLAQGMNGLWWYTDSEYCIGEWASIFEELEDIVDTKNPEEYGKKYGKEINLEGFKKAFQGEL